MKYSFVLLLAAVQLAAAAEIQRPGENVALGKSYKLDPRPTYVYCTDPADATQLTDGKYTRGYFWTQKSTVGWQNVNTATITLDLGAVQPIRGVSFNTAAGVAGVEWPNDIGILVSDDGQKYFMAGELVGLDVPHGGPPREGYAVHRYWTDALQTHGRYVKLVIAPGGPFVFADEIEVYKGEAGWLQLPFHGEAITDPKAYHVHFAIERRLRADLQAVRAADGQHKLTAELDAIGRELSAPPCRYDPDFRAVLPLNKLHERIFQAQAALWRAAGANALTLWPANPWDPLSVAKAPPSDTLSDLHVALMQNEYRAAAFNLANATEQALKLRVRISGLPGGINPDWITVHEVAWTDTKSGKPVAAALPEAPRQGDDFFITAPAGLPRQVWLTLHPTQIPPGTYRGRITVEGNGIQQSATLNVRIAPLRFPDQPTLHLGGWDYTNVETDREITPQNREAVLAHLRSHFVDSPWATAAVWPANRDTANFDRWIARWPNARQYCVFASVESQFDGAKLGTPEFEKKTGEWLKFWVHHAGERGLKPEQLVLLLLDEPHEAQQDAVILAWAKALRAVQSGVKIWEDPIHNDPTKANQEMMALCDVLCPNRPMYLAGKQMFRDYYAQRHAAGTELAFYSCSGPVRLLDPYAYHRLQAWTCWQQGARATYFWSFGDGGGGSSWNEYAQQHAASYVPFFLDPTGVTAGKHMEAIRESVEDYEYLAMLSSKVAAAEQAGRKGPQLERARKLLAEAADRVLNATGADHLQWAQSKNRTIADQVRVEILDVLTEL